MNERVQVTSQGFTTQYAFGLNGQRVSSWDGIACAPTLLSANTYWNGTPVSVFDGYQSCYQHQDLLGTKRLLTGSDGSVIGTSTSLPFGDGLRRVAHPLIAYNDWVPHPSAVLSWKGGCPRTSAVLNELYWRRDGDNNLQPGQQRLYRSPALLVRSMR